MWSTDIRCTAVQEDVNMLSIKYIVPFLVKTIILSKTVVRSYGTKHIMHDATP
jgi:hypothetical protein